MNPNKQGIPIPVNALTTSMIEEALQNAIDREEYEVAQKLKDELERRKELGNNTTNNDNTNRTDL